MGQISSFRLRTAPLYLKILTTAFLVALTFGYGISLFQIRTRTGFGSEGAIRHYRGSDTEEGIFVPQSTGTMVSVAHVHSLSQPVVVGLVGFLFLFTGVSEGWKIFWVLVPFAGSLFSNLSPWLIRDVSSQFVSLLYLSGLSMFLGFLVMASTVLRETWSRS